MRDFFKRLRGRRRELDFSQRDVDKKANISQLSTYKMEKGKILNINTLDKIAEVLGGEFRLCFDLDKLAHILGEMANDIQIIDHSRQANKRTPDDAQAFDLDGIIDDAISRLAKNMRGLQIHQERGALSDG